MYAENSRSYVFLINSKKKKKNCVKIRIFKKRVNNHKRTLLLEKQRKREGEALTNIVDPTMSRQTDRQ